MLRTVAQVISWLSLVALMVPSVLFMADRMDLAKMKMWMMVATVVWFIFASLWMWNEDEQKEEEA